jgi:hypothetical protein
MIIAVDFDGTCVEHQYPNIGQAAPQAVETLRELVAAGHKLILWTVRDGKQLCEAVAWFRDNGIALWGANKNPEQPGSSPKAHADLFIDDLAFGMPMTTPEGFAKPVVDWAVIRRHFKTLEAQGYHAWAMTDSHGCISVKARTVGGLMAKLVELTKDDGIEQIGHFSRDGHDLLIKSVCPRDAGWADKLETALRATETEGPA